MTLLARRTSCLFALLALVLAGSGGNPFAADTQAPLTEPELGTIVSRTLLHAPDGTPDTRTTVGIGKPVECRLVPSVDKSGRTIIPRLQDDTLGLIAWRVLGKDGPYTPLWNITGDVTVITAGGASVAVETHATPAKAVVPGK